ncbi:MAG TPA: AAA family ATPase [Candidatus Paceibacterota bacterium]|nr:AAA family ATPase [Candidatus Paceibacterota bacterium]
MSKTDNDFERSAKRIHRFLRTDRRYDEAHLPAPFIIEFTGSPSSGKTTTITELDKFLRRHDFRVLRPQEGAEVIRHIPRTTPLYNIRTGLYALSHLIDFAHGHMYDVVIFDRAIFDTYAWMLYWKQKGLLAEDECARNQAFFLSRFWTDRITACFVMVCDPKEAMERELKIALSDKLGETSNPDTMRALAERYRTLHKDLSGDFSQLVLIDTTTVGEADMVKQVAATTLAMIEASITRRSAP